jgi:perosamine synthetase
MHDTIPWAKPELWGAEHQYLNEALQSTWISGGPFVDRLERDFATYCAVPHALTAANGTAALHMALLALGVRPGDEVIVPGFAFMAAANVTLHLGAKPVFAEVDAATWCLSAAAVERCLSPHTKVIVPVHTYGNVCPMDDIGTLARAHGVALLEDAAEALGSRYKNRLAGTFGTIGSFSFQATKTITTGEGGMVVTDSSDLHHSMSLYRNHGMLQKRYWHEVPGHNFRLTNLQAAIGCAQLENLDRIVAERQRVHAGYRQRLAEARGLTLQAFAPAVDPVLWMLAVKLDPGAYPQGRDTVIQQLHELGVETRPGFYAASLMDLYGCPPLPICEEISRQVLSLPTYPALRDHDLDVICNRLQGLSC